MVSAREELFAFPGAADGGIIALLAAESGELFAAESLGVAVPVLLLQEQSSSIPIYEEINSFFIKRFFMNKRKICQAF